MGNGAGVGLPNNPIGNPNEHIKNYEFNRRDFLQLEKRCRNGHYKSNENRNEYVEIFRKAILYEALDIVEILIVYGDSKMLDPSPLHIAAELGSIDSLEILLSAGFDWSYLDSMGQSPLHYCTKLDSTLSTLCVTLLCLQSNKRILNIKDKNGNEAIHCSILNNNINVTNILLQFGANINSPNKKGKTAKDIAYENNLENIITLFKSNNNTTNTFNNNKMIKQEQKPIDSDRIMAVWEKFFENAMKQFESEMDTDESLLYDYNGINSALKSISGGDNNNNNSYYNNGNYNNSNKKKKEKIAINPAIIEWFDWTLCYYDAAQEYYFINNKNGTSRWFDDHCKIQKTLGIFNGYKKDSSNYASTLEDAVGKGYCTYYDKVSNKCYWYDLMSYNLLLCLPIGLDPMASAINLFTKYEESDEWLESDQTVALAWILVVLTDEEIEQLQEELKDNNNNSKKSDDKWDTWDNFNESGSAVHHTYYYCNRLTGDASYSKPASYTVPYHGWQLCVLSNDWNRYHILYITTLLSLSLLLL